MHEIHGGQQTTEGIEISLADASDFVKKDLYDNRFGKEPSFLG